MFPEITQLREDESAALARGDAQLFHKPAFALMEDSDIEVAAELRPGGVSVRVLHDRFSDVGCLPTRAMEMSDRECILAEYYVGRKTANLHQCLAAVGAKCV
jgi:hypothetical protein